MGGFYGCAVLIVVATSGTITVGAILSKTVAYAFMEGMWRYTNIHQDDQRHRQRTIGI